MNLNQYGQAVGAAVENWSLRPLPGDVVLQGRYCRLEPLDVARHADSLYEAYALAGDGRDWTYMFSGPFTDRDEFVAYATKAAQSIDPKHFAVIDLKLNRAVGTLSLMRIDPVHGSIEVGNVAFSPLLKQQTAATEAHFLLMQYAFDELNYRRYEWKCDSLNAPSRSAALRLGFSFEGIFRQAIVYKGRSRDTAWYSIIDPEWPHLKHTLQTWLAASNFDEQGQQKQSLQSLNKA